MGEGGFFISSRVLNKQNYSSDEIINMENKHLNFGGVA